MPSKSTSRLLMVARTLDPTSEHTTARGARATIARELEAGRADAAWLFLAVVEAELPPPDRIKELQRSVVVKGAYAALRDIERAARRSDLLRVRPVSVKIVVDRVLVDVHHTARTSLATGIQRVARMTLREWASEHDVLPLGWNRELSAMRELAPGEQSNALYGSQPHAHERRQREVLVPWRSRYFLLELAIEDQRVERLAALAQFSGNTCMALGFDCVPLTSSETTGAGMGRAFAKNLGALAHFDTITTISGAAAREYTGWSQMLAGVGLPGPSITSVLLPGEAGAVDAATVESARSELGLSSLPVVLCVGSHEPRKNHGAVVHAADVLWGRGHEFQLVFIGGNSWGERAAYLEIEALKKDGKPITMVSKPSDDLLWAAYKMARFSVFPSLNEGFGLPVAESLALGTPVVTSRFGSMAEIAAQGGCVLIDPRDDGSIVDAMERLLVDDDLLEHLRREAAQRAGGTWSEYARRVWRHWVNG